MRCTRRNPRLLRSRGMVVPVIAIMLGVLMTFLLLYSRSLSQRHRHLRRVQIGTLCSHLAIGCANVIAQIMEKETGSIYEELSSGHLSRYSYLLSRRLQAGERADIPIPHADMSRYAALAREMVEQANIPGVSISFEDAKVFFQGVTRIVSSEDPSFSYQDYLEKEGFLTVEVSVCSTTPLKIRKKARIKRPFKEVNLLPPVLSRFVLFSAQTQKTESFNVVNFAADGTLRPRPLDIRPGPHPIVYSTSPALPPDTLDLQLNGWVGIGPTPSAPNDNVYLNLADGYGPAGQMFLFGKDPGQAVIRLSVQNPVGLRHWLNTEPFPVMLFHRFEGISTPKQEQYNTGSILGGPIPPGVSWLRPFGSHNALSRTLVFGPVFARVLKFVDFGPYGWKPDGPSGIEWISDVVDATRHAWNNRVPVPAPPLEPDQELPTQISGLYSRAKAAGADTSHAPANWGDVFTNPARYEDYCSREVFFPFNQCFDLVRHPEPTQVNLPSWFFMPIDPNNPAYINDDSIRGLARTVCPGSSGGLLNAYLVRDFLTFGYSQGPGREFFRFAGDMNQFRNTDLVSILLEGKATHRFVLQGSSPAAEVESLKAQLLVAGSVLDRDGVIMVIRDQSSQNIGPLPLPSDLKVSRNAILMFDRGDVIIDGIQTISPDIHLTMVLLNGSFHVSAKVIEAFLIAMKPPTSAFNVTGRIFSQGGTQLHIDGGLAVHDLGVPDQGASWHNFFPDGGWIRYNHTFNPCNYWMEDYYSLYLSDACPFVEVIEG